MSRDRLTNRVASDMKSKPGTQVEAKGSGVDNDPYNMNDTGHEKNDPSVGEYAKGDPEAWKEGVNKDNPAKDDKKREETGHAPLIDKHAAEEAIASARRLEEKAVKAIIASQRMLPGATDEIIEKQAGILMHLPEEGLNSTLAHQESLAQMIAKAAEDSSEDEDKEEEKEEDKDAATEEKDAGKEEEEEEKEATTEEKDAVTEDKDAATEEKEEDKEAATEEMTPQEKLASLKKQAEELEKQINAAEEKEEEACKKEAGEDEEKKEDDKEASSEKGVEASDANLLDDIFSGVMPPPIKKGASKLSGMVKKEASAGSDGLSDLWSSAPDVSSIFN